MERKLLIVDLKDPSKSHYRNYKKAATWFLGKIIADYKIFCITGEHGYEIDIQWDTMRFEKSLIIHFAKNPEGELKQMREKHENC